MPDVRRAVFFDAETRREYTFITNHFKLSAQATADIYKQRRSPICSSSEPKQNLKIEPFLGIGKNAVMTQIWAAMSVYLLPNHLKFCKKVEATPQQIIRLLAIKLFAKRGLLQLIKAGPPPNQLQCVQAAVW